MQLLWIWFTWNLLPIGQWWWFEKKSSLECGQFLAGGISPNVFYSIIPWIQKSFFDDDVSTFKYIDYCFYCCEKIPIVSVEGLFSQSLQAAKKLDDLVSFFYNFIQCMKNNFSSSQLWLKAWNCCLAWWCTLEIVEVSSQKTISISLLLCTQLNHWFVK